MKIPTPNIPTMAPTAPPSVWRMYRSMVGVGIACGALIVSVFQVTRPIIERNQAEALQRAIFQVLPAARSSAIFRFTEANRFERVAESGDAARTVYAGYDEQNRLVGLAVEAQAMGYADVIRVLYGYSFAEQAIVGIRVLESKETPGLGDKIEKDPDFLRNFERLDATVTADGSALANTIVAVKSGQKQSPWEVDGITGATISSKAIAKMLATSSAVWIPKIRSRLADFSADGTGKPRTGAGDAR